MTYPPIDFALSQRLERAEAAANARFVEARAVVQPDRGACWRDADGTWAMFDGVGSPLTQTFCLGMAAPADASTLDTLEEFFRSRGATVEHEVSPMALGQPLALLAQRGYVPVELTSVMFRPPAAAGSATPEGSPHPVRVIDPAQEGAAWTDAVADGWSETPEVVPFVRDIGEVYGHTTGARCFAVEIEGVIAAGGVLAVHDGVALLAGASTRPAFRRRGAQQALLDARLRRAHAEGCTLAMMCAQPGSASHRNAERQGFRVAYTRIKWRLQS
jgi:GNAT superfamily N-acetyltransferase